MFRNSLLILLMCISVQVVAQQYLALAKQNEKWGYINQKGEWVIEAKYYAAKDFCDGIALVQTENSSAWQYINSKAEVITAGKNYTVQHDFVEGRARIKIGEASGCADPKGDVVIEAKYKKIQDFSEGLAAVMLTHNWGFIDKQGNYVVESKFISAKDFHDGISLVKLGKTWAYTTKEGTIISKSREFNIKHDFSEGFARIEKDKKWGFLNKKGEIAIKLKYDDVEDFAEGLAAVRIGESWGFINSQDTTVVELKYQKTKNFSEGMALVMKNQKWMYVNTTGTELIIPFEFVRIHDFVDGIARVELAEGKFGFIDKTGQWKIKPEYSGADNFKNGYARVAKNNLWGFIDVNGKVIVQPTFEALYDLILIP